MRNSLRSLEVGSGIRLNVPVHVNGGKGTLRLGSNVTFGYAMAPCLGNGAVLVQPRTRDSAIHIGDNTVISNNCAFVAAVSIRIGRGCLIGDLAAVFDCDFHEIDPTRRRESIGATSPVTIGNNVWLGSRVMVLRGVTIGDNSVVGAGSIVTRSVPANSVAVGVPGKVIRTL